MSGDSAPILVVVTGPPASGKSGLAADLAEALRLPLVTKDGIKETLFDVLGAGDEDWSKRLGEASWLVLFEVLEELVRGGCSLVVEGNFEPAYANARFAALPPFRAVQVFCDAPREKLLERFRERDAEGDRHPGHAEGPQAEAELAAGLDEARWRPLGLPGPLLEYRRASDKRRRRKLKAQLAQRVAELTAG